MKRREFLYLTGVSAIGPTLLASASAVKSAQTAQTAQPNDRFEELSTLVQSKMTEYHIPGVSFGVLKNGKTVVRSFGITNVEDPLPVTPDTVFPIASISKTFATTTMMRLIDQGKVELKAPVQKYIPDFKVQG